MLTSADGHSGTPYSVSPAEFGGKVNCHRKSAMVRRACLDSAQHSTLAVKLLLLQELGMIIISISKGKLRKERLLLTLQ